MDQDQQTQDEQPQNEQQSMPPTPEQPMPDSAPAPQPVAAPVAPPPRPSEQAPAKPSEPRNFLVAFLMTISFGFYGLHQVYLGRKVQGWIRFGLALIAYPLSAVLVGLPILLVLSVWTAVDFFIVFFKRTDGEGKPLTVTKRDALWAKVIFIVSIVVWGLYIATAVLVLSFLAASGIYDSVQNFDAGQGLDAYNFSNQSY